MPGIMRQLSSLLGVAKIVSKIVGWNVRNVKAKLSNTKLGKLRQAANDIGVIYVSIPTHQSRSHAATVTNFANKPCGCT
jgi:hypothetical protein